MKCSCRAKAMLPRTGCRGVPEAPDYAIYRGQVDIALCSVLSDGGLRRSVAAALAWGDVEIAADGSGRVRIARPKTDQEGGGEFVAITPSTVQALEAIRNGAGDDSSVFGMSDSTSTTMRVLIKVSSIVRRRKSTSCSIQNRPHSPTCTIFFPFCGLTIGANFIENTRLARTGNTHAADGRTRPRLEQGSGIPAET